MGAKSGYLRAQVNGFRQDCLLDSGSEVSIMPGKVAIGLPIRETSKKLKAANGSEIKVKGEVTFPLVMGKYRTTVHAIVSDHVVEPMLGFDWMLQHKVSMDFGSGKIQIGRWTFPMLAKRAASWCRRVVLQSDVVIPDFYEQDVAGRVEYSRIPRVDDDNSHEWGVEAKTLQPGLYMPRAVLPSRDQDVPIRVMNISGQEKILRAGTV